MLTINEMGGGEKALRYRKGRRKNRQRDNLEMEQRQRWKDTQTGKNSLLLYFNQDHLYKKFALKHCTSHQ